MNSIQKINSAWHRQIDKKKTTVTLSLLFSNLPTCQTQRMSPPQKAQAPNPWSQPLAFRSAEIHSAALTHSFVRFPLSRNSTVGPSLQTIGNITHILRRCAFAIGEIALVNRARIVQSQGAIDGGSGVGVVELLEVALIVFRACLDH